MKVFFFIRIIRERERYQKRKSKIIKSIVSIKQSIKLRTQQLRNKIKRKKK